MKRRKLPPEFQDGDRVRETATGQIGKVVRKGEQQSEVRWQDGHTQIVSNRWLVRHDPD